MAEILASPVVEALLAAIILISLAAEVKTVGFSGGALVAAVAGAILIGSRWGEGSPSVLEFVLFFSGMALIIMDILFLFSGAAAVIGLVAVMTGLFFTFGGGVMALYILAAAVILSAFGFYFIAGHLSQSRLWRKLTLHTELKGKAGFHSSASDYSGYVGRKGTALSVLRPAGKVKVADTVLDAVSDGPFIEQGKPVEVKSAQSSYVVVREIPAIHS